MLCNGCKGENRPDSKFCRFCGLQFSVQNQENQRKDQKIINISLSGIVSNLCKLRISLNKKAAFIISIILLGAGVATFAAPKVKNYLDVNKFINEARKFEIDGDYQRALATLSLTSGKWTLGSKRQEVDSARAFISALEKEKGGMLIEAREILRGIDSKFSRYEEVKEKLNEIQLAIESNLEEKARQKEEEAKRASASAAEAKRRAQTEADARARAEADQAASAARMRAEADARSRAEQATREAEYQRQQEEAERIRQVRISFVNQLVSIYNSYNNNGTSYYNSAMSSYNAGNNLAALAVFGQARAVYQGALENSTNLISNFTGMPSDYNQATLSMKTAAYYMVQATDSIMNAIAEDSPLISMANYYAGLADTHDSMVSSFLKNVITN